MKQTNHAMTFLNSSYQAVFKHAYFAGIASSFAMLISSPYAFALGTFDNFAANAAQGKNTDVLVRGPSQQQATLDHNGWANTIRVSGTTAIDYPYKNAILNIKSSEGVNTNAFFQESIVVENGGLKLSGSSTSRAFLFGSLQTTNPIVGRMEFNNSLLNIDYGVVSVDKASLKNTEISIDGLTGYQGQTKPDIFINYSALRTGQYGLTNSTQAGDTVLEDITLNLKDYSALDAMGDVNFNGGEILINAQKVSAVEKPFGEIAAKAIIRADQFNISQGTTDSHLKVTDNAEGAIFANAINLNSGSITVGQGSKLLLAGNINLYNFKGEAPSDQSSTRFNLSTNFEAGQLNIQSGSIANNGELVLGANDIDVVNGKIEQYHSNSYEVLQTGGSFTNSGTLDLGEKVTDGIDIDLQSGNTNYVLNGSKASINNSGSSALLNLNQGSNLIVQSGKLYNTGTLQIEKGATLDFQDGTLSNTGTGTLVVNDSGTLSIANAALKSHQTKHSITQGQNMVFGDIWEIGNVDLKSGGTVELKDGLFLLTNTKTSSFGEMIFAALDSANQQPSAGTIYINNATLQLDNTNLDLSSVSLVDSNLKGKGSNAVLETTGDLTFGSFNTSDSTTEVGSLAGFTKLQGTNVTFTHNNADPDGKTWLNSSSKNGHKTFAATNSITTSDSSTLGIGPNVTLELTTQQFQDNITDLASANSRTPDEHQVKVDLEIASGGTLKVSADPWVAQDINVDSGAKIDMVTSQTLNSTPSEVQHTLANLSANNLTLNGTLNLSGAKTNSAVPLETSNGYALDIANKLTVGQTGNANLTNNSLHAAVLDLQGKLNLDNSVVTINTIDASNLGSISAAESGSISAINGSIVNAGSTNLGGGVTFNIQGESTLNFGGEVKATGTGNSINLNNSTMTAGNVLLSLGSHLSATSASDITLSSLHTLNETASQYATPEAGSNNQNNQVTLDNSILTITGDNDESTADLSVAVNLVNKAEIYFTDAADSLGLQYVARTNDFTVGEGFKQLNTSGSTIRLNMKNVGLTEIDNTARENLFDTLAVSNDPSVEPYFILEGINLSDIDTKPDESGNTFIDFVTEKDDVTGNLEWNFEAENTQNSILINVDTKANIAGGFKAVVTANTQDASNALDGINVNAGKILNIYGNYNDGNLISNKDGQTVGASLGDKASLGLKGSGNIGEITGTGIINVGKEADVKVVASADGSKPSQITGQTLNSSGTLTADTINVSYGNLNLGSILNTKDLNVATKLITSGAEIKAENIQIADADFNNTKVNAKNLTAEYTLWTSGSGTQLDITDTMHIKSGINILGDAVVNANKLLVTGSGDIGIGSESNNGSQSSTGKLVAKQLDLNGNNLVIDPDFGKMAATAFVQTFTDLDNSESNKAADGVLAFNGNVIVGRNSAFGLGGEESEFTDALKKHQDSNGSLQEDKVGALAYINQAEVSLNGHKLIVGSETIDKLREIADTSTDAIYLGQSAGLQIGAKALTQLRDNNESLVFNDLDSSDSVKSTEGKLIVPADITKEEIARIFGTEVNLADGSVINVQTDNGAYTGIINSTDDLHGTGDFSMTKAPNARQILNKMSAPTFDYYTKKMEATTEQQQLVAQAQSSDSAEVAVSSEAAATASAEVSNDQKTTQDTANSELPEIAQTQADGSVKNLAYDYIRSAGSTGDGAALEHAARLGALGVGVQVANQVTKASADVIMQRMNMEPDRSANGTMDVITNDNSALWISSIYQDFSADEFGADDLTYGSDIDLYGLALGFDHTFSSGIKIGAMANVGKGDAAGTGIATGVKNEFRYYGAGIFASVKPVQDLTLTADVTYTVVDNDLSSESGLQEFGNLTSSMDSNALSAGLTGKYTLNLGPLNVSPHAGIRYTRLDLDSYDVKVDGSQLAHTETEAANVISVPVGLSLSSTIYNGDWVIQPSADFTVTKNFGDDKLMSTTTFDQQTGDIKYNTEFIDSVTYGANAGLQIRKGNFSIGANAGYTKSSNTDELSVGANARFLF